MSWPKSSRTGPEGGLPDLARKAPTSRFGTVLQPFGASNPPVPDLRGLTLFSKPHLLKIFKLASFFFAPSDEAGVVIEL